MEKLNWCGQFSDYRIEKKFQKNKWPYARIRLLILYFFSIATYVAGACTDYYDLGAGLEFNKLFLVRAGAIIFWAAAFIVLLKDTAKLKIQFLIMSFSMFIFISAEAFELVVKHADIGSLSIPAAVFMVLAYYIFLPPCLLPSILPGLLGSAVYLFFLSYVVPSSGGTFIKSAVYFLMANGFGIFFLSSFGMSLRREYAALRDLKKLVEYDSLTGAYSRRRVLEAGTSLFRSARRFDHNMAVLMLDIDKFKSVNDEFGHHVGDYVLQETSRRCLSVLREVDFYGRMGGEEFLIVLPHADLQQAILVAERLRSLICSRVFVVDGVSLPVTLSIGAAQLQGEETFSMLLEKADKQLYEAKRSGRNMVCPQDS